MYVCDTLYGNERAFEKTFSDALCVVKYER